MKSESIMETNKDRNEGKPQLIVTAARRSKDGTLLLTRCKYVVEDGKKVSKSMETFYSSGRAVEGKLLEVGLGCLVWPLLACAVWALARYVL
jgi:hypothetical protein